MALMTPLWMQAATGDTALDYSGVYDRMVVDALLQAEGVLGLFDLKVTQRAAGANFSVDVGAGFVAINGDDITDQGTYICKSTAVENRAIPAPPGTGSRTHRVVAQVKDKLHAPGTWSSYEWAIEVLPDTGSGTPATPNSAISLARVTVAAGQTSVTDANIVDDRPTALTWASRPPRVGADWERPAGNAGLEILRTDKGYGKELWDGNGWRFSGPKLWALRTVDSDPRLASGLVGDGMLKILNVPPDRAYEFRGTLIFSTHQDADLQVALSGPAGFGCDLSVDGAMSREVLTGFPAMTFMAGTTASNTPKLTAHLHGHVYSGDGGTIEIHWAPNVTHATVGAIMRAQSMFILDPFR